MTTFDNITRFLCARNEYNQTRVKYPAFMPKNFKTSAYSINGLSPDEIWDIGKGVAESRGRNLHGRGDLPSAFIDNEIRELSLDPNDNPPGHADIVGWPDEELIQIQLSTKLAGACGTPILLR